LRLDRKLHNADRRSWDEKVCINCGGSPIQQVCAEHFYSKEEHQDYLLRELLERVDALERRGTSYPSPVTTERPVKKKFQPDISKERKAP
jgi:hypothetical protein